jgi:NAD(P)H-dependent FMN reductase
MKVGVFSGMGEIPLFNPDLESSPPAPVLRLRREIDCADALLLASPEYAHGISGVMKNALDWLVSFEGTVNKPIALINTSPRAHHAYDALREVLRTMSTHLIEDASLSIPLLGKHNTYDSMRSDPAVCNFVQRVLSAIATHLDGTGPPRPVFPVS